MEEKTLVTVQPETKHTCLLVVKYLISRTNYVIRGIIVLVANGVKVVRENHRQTKGQEI